MRFNKMSLYVILFCMILFLTLSGAEKNPFHKLSRQDRGQLLKLVFDSKPFLQTAIDTGYPATMNRFFSPDIYRKLQGNPFVGYIYDEGVIVTGRTITIDRIDAPPELAEYCKIFEALFRKMAAKTENGSYDFKFDASGMVGVGIYICDITHKSRTKKLIPSITLECYFKDKTGRAFFKRFSTASGYELYNAMRLAIKRIYLDIDFLAGK